MSSACIWVLWSLFPISETANELARHVKEINGVVLDDPTTAARMIADDARSRRDAANRKSTEQWQGIQSRADWEKFRAEKLERLRDAVGFLPISGRKQIEVHVTRRLAGKGLRVENILFESRPGLVVTANLYLPEKTLERMPGIVLAHSHHNPKSESELQEMGIGWARQGCAVIVPDLPGHGERRQHPFRSAVDFAGNFRPGRQDYYFRYFAGMQLHLMGSSLCGWIATDLSRCVDALLSLPEIDKSRVLLFGSVAGGGDPAAVAAALDERITMAAIYNFGGPQPESPNPLPEDAATRFNYAGGGSWESTRNLSFSCRDGFLPWVIVGSIAPRKLIYAHEFSWDRERDPVWARLQKIWSWYAADDLASAHGTGKLTGKGPEASHCNNIGRVHRASMSPALKRWYGLEPPLSEAADRRTAEELRCVTADAPLKLRPIHELLRDEYAKNEAQFDASRVRSYWGKLLLDRVQDIKVVSSESKEAKSFHEERLILEVEPSIRIPVIILRPSETKKRPAAVIAVSQDGKALFLTQRSQEIALLLRTGIAVVLPDLRGTGETRPGDGRGRTSNATSISSTELMLGRSLLALRLRDLRAVLHYVRSRKEFDNERIGVWGDSFATPNAPEAKLAVPLDADPQPKLAEPLGGLLALFAALFEKDIRCVSLHGGLIRFADLLESPFINMPHDIIVPGALRGPDLDKVAVALAPRPIRITGLVDGHNLLVRMETADMQFRRGPYRDKRELLHMAVERGSAGEFAGWWIKHLTP